MLYLVRASVVLLLLSGMSLAASYPDRPIKLVVPVGAGSSSDLRARQIGEKLSLALGQPVIVENKPGASGTIGASHVAKSKADGYTLLYGTIADQGIAPAIYSKLAYDPRKDFVALVQNSLVPPILVVNPKAGFSSFHELVESARRHPGQLTMGSWGEGSLTHLLGLQLS